MGKTIHFTADFDYRPTDEPTVIFAYLADSLHDVSDECAAFAVFANCGVEVAFSDDLQDDDDLTDWDA